VSSNTSSTLDLRVISKAEAQSYYAGLPSEPTLVYRTGKQPWTFPRGPESRCDLKELREVFNYAIARISNDDLAWKVSVLDDHKVS